MRVVFLLLVVSLECLNITHKPVRTLVKEPTELQRYKRGWESDLACFVGRYVQQPLMNAIGVEWLGGIISTVTSLIRRDNKCSAPSQSRPKPALRSG